MIVSTMPDVAKQAPNSQGTLTRVGMEGIAMPVLLGTQRVAAKLDATVSLDAKEARGIHMSRLYLGLAPLEQTPLSLGLVQSVLESFLASQEGLSQHAYLNIAGELPLERAALISPLSGWKYYPFTFRCELSPDGFQSALDLEVGYSSTCPCSAALARQLIQQAFEEDFEDIPLSKSAVLAWLGSEEGILATPHSQRSVAHLKLRLATMEDAAISIETFMVNMIDRVERALGTALQTAVKRIDEQAFALANGQNLMFCEDAARRLDTTLRQAPGVSGFQLKVVHAESLHAHDAVAYSEWWE